LLSLNIEQLAIALIAISIIELLGLLRSAKSLFNPPFSRNKSASFDLLVSFATVANAFLTEDIEELLNFLTKLSVIWQEDAILKFLMRETVRKIFDSAQLDSVLTVSSTVVNGCVKPVLRKF
jgi:hypothetical protein